MLRVLSLERHLVWVLGNGWVSERGPLERNGGGRGADHAHLPQWGTRGTLCSPVP